VTGERDAALLDTLAAACAAAGRYDAAVAAARRALDLAMSKGPANLVGPIRERLRTYESRKPFREAPRQ
jgi:hypothetical protein